MDIKVLALFLITLHLVSVFFIIIVLWKQAKLFQKRIQDDLVMYRLVLFALAVVIFSANMIPIVIDLLTIFNQIVRSTSTINPIGVLYSMSNAIVCAASATLMWTLYKLAERVVFLDVPKRKRRVQ